MQILMFDPRENPTATADMLADTGLTGAIAAMRKRAGRKAGKADRWPYVEGIDGAGGRTAWAVDDAGLRYVVVRNFIFTLEDLIADPQIRKGVEKAFERLDQGVAA